MKYKVVLIGCGRSGTTFMTDVLKKNGYKVGHECLGQDGGCGWKLLEKHNVDLWEGDCDNVIHIVRNPLDCIASMQTHVQSLFDTLSVNLGTINENKKIKDKVHLASKVWLDVNKYCYEKSDGIYINIENHKMIGDIIEMKDLHAKGRRNKRPHKLFTKRILSSPYWPEIQQFSQKFGY